MATFVGVIYPNQLDHMGHVNVQYYASMFDQATWTFLSEFGITSEYMNANHRGMAAVSQHTNYLLELFSGDIVEIQTELLEVSEKTIKFVHTMRRKPQMDTIATSELVGVHFDTEIHKSCPFPHEIKERLLHHASDSKSDNQQGLWSQIRTTHCIMIREEGYDNEKNSRPPYIRNKWY